MNLKRVTFVFLLVPLFCGILGCKRETPPDISDATEVSQNHTAEQTPSTKIRNHIVLSPDQAVPEEDSGTDIAEVVNDASPETHALASNDPETSSEPEEAAEADTGRLLRGKTVLWWNNEPVPGIRVRCQGEGFERTTTTDASGEYGFRNVPEGRLFLAAWSESLVTLENDVVIFEATGEGTFDTPPLRVNAGAEVAVSVRDGVTGQPIPGAQVSIRLNNPPGQAVGKTSLDIVTNSAGGAHVKGFLPGRATLRCTCEGYVPSSNESAVRNLNLELGAVRGIDIPLVRLGGLSGRVVDNRGNPIDGATVTASGAQSTQIIVEVRTGWDGRFSMGEIAQRTVSVRAEKENYHASRKQEVRIPSGDLELVMQRKTGEGTLHGQVLNALTREPVRSFRAALLHPNHPPITTESEYGGTFRFDNVPAGRVRVSVASRDYLPGFSESVNFDPKRPQQEPLTILLHQSGSIEGVVVNSAGEGVGGTQVSVQVSDRAQIPPDQIGATQTGGDGHFLLENVPAGPLVLHANHPDFGPARSDLLIVQPGQSLTGVIITITTAGTIQGHVRLPDGSPDPDRRVKIQKYDTGPEIDYFATTDADGFYHKPGLAAGVYWVQVQPRDSFYHPVASEQVDLEPGKTRVVDFGTDGVRLYGRITLAGEPQKGCLVILGNSANRQFYTSGTDENGQFEFDFLYPGYFTVVVHAPYSSREYYTGGVRIPNNVQEYEHNIAIPEASISGVVTTPERWRYVTNALVTVHPTTRKVDITGWFQPDESARTNEQGQFTIRGLSLGEYTISAMADGYGQKTTTMTLQPGANHVHLVLELLNRGSIRLHVMDSETGLPIHCQVLLTSNGIRLAPVFSVRMEEMENGYEISVAPGTIRIAVAAAGYVSTLQDIQIDEGAEEPVWIGLERGRRVRFSFRDDRDAHIVPDHVELYDSRGFVDNALHAGIWEWFLCTLAEGPGHIVAGKSGHETVTQEFHVPRAEIDFSLENPYPVNVILNRTERPN